MRIFLVFPLILLAACSFGHKDPSFDITAQVHQRSIDPDKGIHMIIYPVDRVGEK